MKKGLLFVLMLAVLVNFTFAEEIDFLMMTGSGAREFIEEVVPLFEAETGIKVNVDFSSWGEGWTKIMAAVASGVGPDVTQVGTTWVGALQASGAFESLTQKTQYFGGQESYLGGPWSTSGYNHQVYAIPWFADIRALVYRKDLLEKYDLPSPPKTWGELLYCALVLKDNGEMDFPVGLRGKGSGHYVGSFLWQNGTDVISENGKEVLLDSEKSFESFKFWSDMLNRYELMSPGLADMGHDEICINFFNGNVAFMYPGPWFVLKDDIDKTSAWVEEGKAAVALQPGKNEDLRTGFTGGSNLMIFKESSKKEAAQRWVEFLVRPEIQEKIAKHMFVAPTVKKAYAFDFFKEEPFEQMWKDFEMVGDAGSHYPINPAWGAMESFVPGVIVDIFSMSANEQMNDENLKKLLLKYDEELQNVLDQYQQ